MGRSKRSTSRTKQAKACTRCARKKMRCRQNPEDELGACKRCAKDDKACEWPAVGESVDSDGNKSKKACQACKQAKMRCNPSTTDPSSRSCDNCARWWKIACSFAVKPVDVGQRVAGPSTQTARTGSGQHMEHARVSQQRHLTLDIEAASTSGSASGTPTSAGSLRSYWDTVIG